MKNFELTIDLLSTATRVHKLRRQTSFPSPIFQSSFGLEKVLNELQQTRRQF